MTPERWLHIKELFTSALECAPSDRPGFLDKACAKDDSLRKEVECLLACYDEEESFMETPAVSEVAAKLLKEDQFKQQPGQLICRYKILRDLGAGGMGEVYLA